MARKLPAQALDDGKLDAIKQQIAYKMWEEEGRPEGRSEAHWLAACDVVDAMIANATELPDWLKRIEPAETTATQAREEGDSELTYEKSAGFRDVARRFARGT